VEGDTMRDSRANDGIDKLHVGTLRSERDRLLAFAFCAADFLVELDASLKVSFVRGATMALTGRLPECLVGQSLRGSVS